MASLGTSHLLGEQHSGECVKCQRVISLPAARCLLVLVVLLVLRLASLEEVLC